MHVYLIHFHRPYKHARHYLGSCNNLAVRLDEHARGRGARILKVIIDAGIEYDVVRVWTTRSHKAARNLEKKFKRAQHNTRYCPICNPNGTKS